MRTIASYLDQRTLALQRNLEVRRIKARILEVLFPSHSFVVVAPGYSGPSEVRADPAIAFGTMTRPLVFRGNEVWIEKDETGMWHATQYIESNRCFPTTDPNAPNVPLPTYRPPVDSSTLDWSGLGGVNPIDRAYPPLTIPMGQFSLAKMPSTSFNAYDFGDGYNGIIAANTTVQMLYLTTVRPFKINRLTCATAGLDVTLRIFANNGTYPDITIYHASDSTWTTTLRNPTTGNILQTISAAASNNLLVLLTGSSVVGVPTVGTVFHTEIATGNNSVSALAYGIGAYLYG